MKKGPFGFIGQEKGRTGYYVCQRAQSGFYLGYLARVFSDEVFIRSQPRRRYRDDGRDLRLSLFVEVLHRTRRAPNGHDDGHTKTSRGELDSAETMSRRCHLWVAEVVANAMPRLKFGRRIQGMLLLGTVADCQTWRAWETYCAIRPHG